MGGSQHLQSSYITRSVFRWCKKNRIIKSHIIDPEPMTESISASQTWGREGTFRRRKVAKGTSFYKRSRPMGNWPPNMIIFEAQPASGGWSKKFAFRFGLDTPKLESTHSKETVWSNLVNCITRRCRSFFLFGDRSTLIVSVIPDDNSNLVALLIQSSC